MFKKKKKMKKGKKKLKKGKKKLLNKIMLAVKWHLKRDGKYLSLESQVQQL